MKRILFLCLVACVSLVGMAQSSDGFTVVSPGVDTSFLATALSQDGKYIAGWCSSGVGSALYDVENAEFYYFTGNGGSEMSAVANDGMMIGYGDNGTVAVIGYNPITGEEIVDKSDGFSWAKACTSDASVIAGEYWDDSWTTYACYWTKDGTCYKLPQPDAEEIGFGEDGEYDYAGTEAVGISEDSKTIVGVVYDWYDDGGALIWRKNSSGEYVLDPICKGLVATSFDGEEPYYQYQATAISPNGKYVAMYLQDNGSSTTYMGRYDAETGELVTAKYSTSCTPSRIADDGTMVGWTGDMDSQSRNALIWEPESDIMLLSDKYPDITEFKEWDEQQDWNFPVGISQGGRYIAGGGFHYFEEDGDDAFARYASWITDRRVYDLGIESVRSTIDETSPQAECYTIDGKRLSTPQKGLNIVNGRKVLVK